MVIGNYRLSYDNSYAGHLCRTLWQTPSFKNAVLVAELFKWLIYGIVVGVATAIIAPFLVLYGIRISGGKSNNSVSS